MQLMHFLKSEGCGRHLELGWLLKLITNKCKFSYFANNLQTDTVNSRELMSKCKQIY